MGVYRNKRESTQFLSLNIQLLTLVIFAVSLICDLSLVRVVIRLKTYVTFHIARLKKAEKLNDGNDNRLDPFTLTGSP